MFSMAQWARYVAHMKEMTNAYNILIRKPQGNRALGKPSHR